MLHFIKYLLLTIFLFVVLNVFRSNLNTVVQLHFDLPYIFSWSSPPLALNYLLLIVFTLGLLLAAFTGAFRIGQLKSQAKEVKRLKKELQEVHAQNPSFVSSNNESLPSLAE